MLLEIWTIRIVGVNITIEMKKSEKREKKAPV